MSDAIFVGVTADNGKKKEINKWINKKENAMTNRNILNLLSSRCQFFSCLPRNVLERSGASRRDMLVLLLGCSCTLIKIIP